MILAVKIFLFAFLKFIFDKEQVAHKHMADNQLYWCRIYRISIREKHWQVRMKSFQVIKVEEFFRTLRLIFVSMFQSGIQQFSYDKIGNISRISLNCQFFSWLQYLTVSVCLSAVCSPGHAVPVQLSMDNIQLRDQTGWPKIYHRSMKLILSIFGLSEYMYWSHHIIV